MQRPSGRFCLEGGCISSRDPIPALRRCLGKKTSFLASRSRAYATHTDPAKCRQRRRPPPWPQLEVQAAGGPAQQAGAKILTWHARNPLQLQGRARAAHMNTLAVLPGWQRVHGVLHTVLQFLIQPPGGQPVGVIEALPGWQVKLARGPRRWLGLRPGRAMPVVDPGPFWTPSGLLHLIQSIPNGVWLLLLVWLVTMLVKGFVRHREEQRRQRAQEQASSVRRLENLKYQRMRMLRDLGERVEAPAEEPPPEPSWQDPSEWDPATRRQWDDFMRKSKALRIHKDSWWDITSAEDEPDHKKAYDRIKRSGVNQDDYKDTYFS